MPSNDFYPRSPCGERLLNQCKQSYSPSPFLSTLSLRRATNTPKRAYNIIKISIHALLAESDRHWQVGQKRFLQFLSTLSLRRATPRCGRLQIVYRDFYPRSPCGERLTPARMSSRLLAISIHALLAESDVKVVEPGFANRLFLSTLSLRRATIRATILEEVILYFYPRSPCGERQRNQHQRKQKDDFYPRSPCGERRYLINTYHRIFGISIHALLAESDPYRVSETLVPRQFLSTLSLRRATLQLFLYYQDNTNFYPRSPCGERRVTVLGIQHKVGISIHALLAESD